MNPHPVGIIRKSIVSHSVSIYCQSVENPRFMSVSVLDSNLMLAREKNGDERNELQLALPHGYSDSTADNCIDLLVHSLKV